MVLDAENERDAADHHGGAERYQKASLHDILLGRLCPQVEQFGQLGTDYKRYGC
jgi:hypothetical protein